MTSRDASDFVSNFVSTTSACVEIEFAQESFTEQIEFRFLERDDADINLRNLKKVSSLKIR